MDELTFRKFSDFRRGTMLKILKDAYSFDERYEKCWRDNWSESDAFFNDNLHIADACGFVTCLDGEPIGFI